MNKTTLSNKLSTSRKQCNFNYLNKKTIIFTANRVSATTNLFEIIPFSSNPGRYNKIIVQSIKLCYCYYTNSNSLIYYGLSATGLWEYGWWDGIWESGMDVLLFSCIHRIQCLCDDEREVKCQHRETFY